MARLDFFGDIPFKFEHSTFPLKKGISKRKPQLYQIKMGTHRSRLCIKFSLHMIPSWYLRDFTGMESLVDSKRFEVLAGGAFYHLNCQHTGGI